MSYDLCVSYIRKANSQTFCPLPFFHLMFIKKGSNQRVELFRIIFSKMYDSRNKILL